MLTRRQELCLRSQTAECGPESRLRTVPNNERSARLSVHEHRIGAEGYTFFAMMYDTEGTASEIPRGLTTYRLNVRKSASSLPTARVLTGCISKRYSCSAPSSVSVRHSRTHNQSSTQPSPFLPPPILQTTLEKLGSSRPIRSRAYLVQQLPNSDLRPASRNPIQHLHKPPHHLLHQRRTENPIVP